MLQNQVTISKLPKTGNQQSGYTPKTAKDQSSSVPEKTSSQNLGLIGEAAAGGCRCEQLTRTAGRIAPRILSK